MRKKTKAIFQPIPEKIKDLAEKSRSGSEPFDYLRCIELCIEYGKQKHHISDGKELQDDLLSLAKYESCQG